MLTFMLAHQGSIRGIDLTHLEYHTPDRVAGYLEGMQNWDNTWSARKKNRVFENTLEILEGYKDRI